MSFQSKYTSLYINYQVLIVFGLYDCTVSDLSGIIFIYIKEMRKCTQNQELDVSKLF